MVQDIGHFGLCCISTRKECVLLLMECPVNVKYILLVDGIAKFFCILLDFLFILTVTVEEVLKSPAVFVDFSFLFCQLLVFMFWNFIVWCIHI